MFLFVVVFEDDLFLYEDFDEDEKAIVAFGDNEKEALIILFSYSLKLSNSVFRYDIYVTCCRLI